MMTANVVPPFHISKVRADTKLCWMADKCMLLVNNPPRTRYRYASNEENESECGDSVDHQSKHHPHCHLLDSMQVPHRHESSGPHDTLDCKAGKKIYGGDCF